MTTIERINNLDVEEIVKALWIRYKKLWATLSFYEGGKMTGWWKANINWQFSDFSEKGRASGDRITFVMQYLSCTKHEALNWYEDSFQLPTEEFKPITNPIKDKWEGLKPLSLSQKEYLKLRHIELDWIAKDYNGNICLPIRSLDWNIKQIK